MVARQADSFLGTVSYMDSNRVRGGRYSWEADFWGLGITLIVAVTGSHPYDIENGLWILMKDILESPQPSLNESFDSDLRDFVRACLNAAPNDNTVADQLLQHPLLVAAKARGVISDDRVALLPNPPTHLIKINDTEAGNLSPHTNHNINECNTIETLRIQTKNTSFVHSLHKTVGEINQIVQVSLSWQLEHWGELQGT